MTAEPQTANASLLQRLMARLGGLTLDLGLLAIFLYFGASCLKVLVRVIVLVTGYVQYYRNKSYIDQGWMEWDKARHPEDWKALLLGILIAVVTGFVFFLTLRLRRWLLTRFVDSSFESFVSKRYLISREGGALVNLVTIVSVLGVAVGVMALVVVISVMNGFDRTLVNRMMGVFAHVEMWPPQPVGGGQGEFTMDEAEEIMRMAQSVEGAIAAAPTIQWQTFFQVGTGAGEKKVGAMLRGYDVERERKVTSITKEDSIIAGSGTPGEREVVLGSELARKLRARVGDKVYALGRVIGTGMGTKAKISELRVAGIFKSGIYNVDENFAYANLETVQKLSLSEGVTSIHMAISTPRDVDPVREQLINTLPRSVYVRSWEQINPEFFEALWVEKVAMFIILLLIVIVASFNIIGTLIMVVTQKTREIGILKSMGATNGMIMRIFLFHGVFIGLVGTSLGGVWGVTLCFFVRDEIEKIFKMPEAVYGLDRLPVVIDPTVIGLIMLCSLAICSVAGLLPAFRASRFDPVEALRYD